MNLPGLVDYLMKLNWKKRKAGKWYFHLDWSKPVKLNPIYDRIKEERKATANIND